MERLMLEWITKTHKDWVVEINQEYITITTRFVNQANDHLQIFIMPSKFIHDVLILTDDNQTASILQSRGYDFADIVNHALVSTVFQELGVSTSEQGDICFVAPADRFFMAEHSLLQAMIFVEKAAPLVHEIRRVENATD